MNLTKPTSVVWRGVRHITVWTAVAIGVCLAIVGPVLIIVALQPGRKSSAAMLPMVIVVFGIADVVVTILAVESIRRRDGAKPAAKSPHDARKPLPEPPRPFSSRLSRFVGSESAAPNPDVREEPGSRMPFFMAVDDVERRDPKPAEFFRRILWHIRHLVHGGQPSDRSG